MIFKSKLLFTDYLIWWPIVDKTSSNYNNKFRNFSLIGFAWIMNFNLFLWYFLPLYNKKFIIYMADPFSFVKGVRSYYFLTLYFWSINSCLVLTTFYYHRKYPKNLAWIEYVIFISDLEKAKTILTKKSSEKLERLGRICKFCSNYVFKVSYLGGLGISSLPLVYNLPFTLLSVYGFPWILIR